MPSKQVEDVYNAMTPEERARWGRRHDSVADLERRLAAAKKREADAAASHCLKCNGAGWFEDTTYDRTGAWAKCGHCHGTGWPIGRVRRVFDAAFAKHVQPKP
ncbi:hypothetical protein GGQ68_002538 [Sagittula marina]|uniref:Uncharacterized protein n=1 Tax=Sagittula marina TaxID=943940 RepID=A0A7W6DN68_9RHOB|nr:hypothetical protein [Sagittula marina]